MPSRQTLCIFGKQFLIVFHPPGIRVFERPIRCSDGFPCQRKRLFKSISFNWMYVEFALREYFIWPTLMEKVRDMFIMTRANIWPKPCPQKISRRHPEDSINLCLSQFLIKQTTLSWKILGPGSLLQVGPIFFGLLCLPCSTKRLNLATWMHWKYALANESNLHLRLDHSQFSCSEIGLRAWEVWRVRTWSSKRTKWRINYFRTPVTTDIVFIVISCYLRDMPHFTWRL